MNGNPFYVHPGGNFGPGLSALAGQVQQFGEQKREQETIDEAKQKLEDLRSGALEAFQSGDPDKMIAFSMANPEYKQATQLYEYATHKNEETLQNSVNSTFEFVANPTEENLKNLIAERNKVLDNQGVPPEQRMQTNAALEEFRNDPEGFLKKQQMRAASLNPERYQKMKEALGEDTPDDTTDIKNWNKFISITDPEKKLQFGRAAGFIKKDANPSPTDIDDYVRDGELCRQGDQAACLRNEDRKGFKRAGPTEKAAVQLATDAAEAANAAADKLPVIRNYITQLKEVKRLVDEGAETGVIATRLPSFRQTSLELDNIKNQLGLAVIQSATFGPLSEKELKFALDTALPTSLEGPKLKEWVDNKIAAQQKLLNFTEGAVDYLSVPGNTRAGWVAYQRNRGKSSLPPGVTEADVQYTMGKYNMTRQEVLDKLTGEK